MIERMKKSQSAVIIGSLVFLALTYIPLFLQKEVLEVFVNEDQIYETLTVVYFMLASILLVIWAIRFQPAASERKYRPLKLLSVAGLALLFFVAAGEEISWGQRLFQIETPQAVRDANVQQELTIHNLEFFQGDAATLDFSSLQTIFSLTFAFLIPLLGFALMRFNWNLDAIFPVLPLPLGILVVMNYAYQKFLRYLVLWFPQLYLHPTMPFGEGLYEIREHGHGYAMMVSVLFYLVLNLDLRKGKVTHERAATANDG